MATIPAELESRLKERISRQIELEAECKNPERHLEFIDPALLRKRNHEHENEPADTLADIRDFLNEIESASLLSARVVKFAKVGGKVYGNRPTAIVEILTSISQYRLGRHGFLIPASGTRGRWGNRRDFSGGNDPQTGTRWAIAR